MSLEEQQDSKSDSKRKRPESPVAAITTYEDADLKEEPGGGFANKRVKTERAASPTPSCPSVRSDFSMDLPNNFQGGEMFPLDLRKKFERPASPTPSYLSLRTDWSMDLPGNLIRREGFHLNASNEETNKTLPIPSFIYNNPGDTAHYSRGNTCIVDSARAPSPTLTSVSEWTDCLVEQPTHFKAESTFHLDSRLLTENHLKCPICKSMLKDPVSILCGHNYCRICINTFWDSCIEDYLCPKCGRGSKIRPELNTNTALAEVVKNLQQAGFSPALPPRSYAGPEDVACDFCSERSLKAVKSCLTCDASLCETHIRDHYTVPALQKHKITDLTEAMEKKMSQQNLSVDNSLSSIISEQQEETDRSISESVLNTSTANDAAGISTAEIEVKKDIDPANLAVMYSTLQQEVLGLKKSFSEFKESNTKKDKYYFEDEEDYEEENDKSEGYEDDEESYKDDYDDDDDEEKEDSYEENIADLYDDDYEDNLTESDESSDEDEYEKDKYDY
ncbi:uncharacterized protein [Misgurnus anguillicaudatus]|uniref:uncharacterized protein isoform X1 n=2 Tax=Misgurnus anguillicaudatus TaxID=75329 RepID=UPI003CCF98FA